MDADRGRGDPAAHAAVERGRRPRVGAHACAAGRIRRRRPRGGRRRGDSAPDAAVPDRGRADGSDDGRAARPRGHVLRADPADPAAVAADRHVARIRAVVGGSGRRADAAVAAASQRERFPKSAAIGAPATSCGFPSQRFYATLRTGRPHHGVEEVRSRRRPAWWFTRFGIVRGGADPSARSGGGRGILALINARPQPVSRSPGGNLNPPSPGLLTRLRYSALGRTGLELKGASMTTIRSRGNRAVQHQR